MGGGELRAQTGELGVLGGGRLTALGQALLGRLGALALGIELGLHAGGLGLGVPARVLGLLALALGHVDLAAQLGLAALLARQRTGAGGGLVGPAPRLLQLLLLLVVHAEQARVVDPGGVEHRVPAAEHVVDPVRVGPVVAALPVLGLGQLAGQQRPAVQVVEQRHAIGDRVEVA